MKYRHKKRDLVYSTAVNKTEWKTEECLAKQCSYEPTISGNDICITKEVWRVIRQLCNTIHDEWQLLLKGNIIDGVVVCRDYYIPKQEVTPATVTNNDVIDKEFIETNSIIATIHSHSSMVVSFSSTDQDSTNACGLINYHIVTNNAGDLTAIAMVDLPCGLKKEKEVNVFIEDEQEVEIKGIENITKKTYSNYLPTHYIGV